MIVVTMGYQDYVMSSKDAFDLSEVLARVAIYEYKYHGQGKENTHHVYPNDKTFAMKIISDDVYRIGQLAGKPATE